MSIVFENFKVTASSKSNPNDGLEPEVLLQPSGAMSSEIGMKVDFSHYPSVSEHREQILEIVRRRGTPILLCDRTILVDRFAALQRSLQRRWPRYLIGYSFKTNYLVAETGIFRDLGAWAEVVSGREYRMARRLGYDGASILFNGPYKTDDELRTAFTEGAFVNVNDHDELSRVLAIAETFPRPLEIGLRLGTRLPRGNYSRFGFSIDHGEASEAWQRVERSERVTLGGVHLHLYADTDAPELYASAAQRLGEFLQQVGDGRVPCLKMVNLGGGFPGHTPKPRSRTQWNPQPIDAYVEAVTNALRCYLPDGCSQPTLAVEPGRYLTADGIVLVSKVVHVKRRDGIRMVYGNASISMVPLTHYCPQIIRAYTPDLTPKESGIEPTILYGATCRENDILYEGPFPQVEVGDFLIHFAVGAYNSSLSPEFIFDRPEMELLT